MRALLLVLAVSAGVGAQAAWAQEARIVLMTGSGTADGDFHITESLGEFDIRLMLGVEFSPRPGELLADGSEVVGFGSLCADILGRMNWTTGAAEWQTVDDSLCEFTSCGESADPATDFLGACAGQVPGFGEFSTACPIGVIDLRWLTSDFTWRDVGVDVTGGEGATVTMYIRKPGASFEEPVEWPVEPLSLEFMVDPLSGRCEPDCDGVHGLDINDFICFQRAWRGRTRFGDYNRDGRWNVNDFIVYQAAFRRGC